MRTLNDFLSVESYPTSTPGQQLTRLVLKDNAPAEVRSLVAQANFASANFGGLAADQLFGLVEQWLGPGWTYNDTPTPINPVTAAQQAAIAALPASFTTAPVPTPNDDPYSPPAWQAALAASSASETAYLGGDSQDTTITLDGSAVPSPANGQLPVNPVTGQGPTLASMTRDETAADALKIIPAPPAPVVTAPEGGGALTIVAPGAATDLPAPTTATPLVFGAAALALKLAFFS